MWRAMVSADGTTVGCFEDGSSIVLSPDGLEMVRLWRGHHSVGVDRRPTAQCGRAWLDATRATVEFRNRFAERACLAPRTRKAESERVGRWLRPRVGNVVVARCEATKIACFKPCRLGRLGILSYEGAAGRVACARPLESWSRDATYADLAAVAAGLKETASVQPPELSSQTHDDASFFASLARPTTASACAAGVESLPAAALGRLADGGYPPFWTTAVEWRSGVGIVWVLPKGLEARPVADLDDLAFSSCALVLEAADVCRDVRATIDGVVTTTTSSLDEVRAWPAWRHHVALVALLRSAALAARDGAFSTWWLAPKGVVAASSGRECVVLPGIAALNFAHECARGCFVDGVVVCLDDDEARACRPDGSDLRFPTARPPVQLADHVALVADFFQWARLRPEEREALRLRRSRAHARVQGTLAANRRFQRSLSATCRRHVGVV